MKKARIVLMGGMGYPLTETPGGMPRLKTRFEALGAEVLLVSWDARQEAYNFAHAWDGFLAYFGDSLGAGSAGEYPGDIRRPTDYAGGFQPSTYDERTIDDPQTQNRVQIIAPGIVRAHCVFDPWWIDTAGLGYARWEETKGAKTKLLVTEHRGAHPDDWSWSQDTLFSECERLMKAA